MERKMTLVDEVMMLSRQGFGVQEIARQTGSHRVTVYHIRNQYREQGEVFPGQRRGRPPGGGGWDAHDDRSGQRCPCGLRIDRDHTPETCDMRAGAVKVGRRAVDLL